MTSRPFEAPGRLGLLFAWSCSTLSKTYRNGYDPTYQKCDRRLPELPRTMTRPTIAAGFARALMDLAVMKGADRAALVERSQIASDELLDQDNRVSLEKYVSLMRAGQELAGDPALALHFGEAFDMAELSIVGLLGGACETAAAAFVQLNRYSRLVVDVDGVTKGDRFVLSHIGGRLWLNDARRSPNDFPELTESTFARMVCSARRFGAAQFVTAVHVTHAAPAHRAEYDRIFQIPVTFESDRNALQMSEDHGLRSPPHTHRGMCLAFSARALRHCSTVWRAPSQPRAVWKAS